MGVEASAEIIAKKFFHCGDRLQAWDMFEFALVAEKEPWDLLATSHFFSRAFKGDQYYSAWRTGLLRKQFDAIDTIDCVPIFDYVRELVLRQLSECADYLLKNP